MGKKMKYEIAKSIGKEKEFQQPNCYHGAVSTCGSLLSSLPFEIQIKIVSFIPVADVLSLGRCNKYWRDLCFSNWAWKLLSIKRWPLLSEFLTQTHPVKGYVIEANPKDEWPPNIEEIQKDWKQFYRDRKIFISRVGRTHRHNLTKKYTELANKGYSFIDVELISFSKRASLIVNLIGVLYSINFLKVPRKTVAEALRRRNNHNRVIYPLGLRIKQVYNALVPKKEQGYTLTLEELVMGKRNCNGRIEKEKRIQIKVLKCTSRRYSPRRPYYC